MKKNEKKMKKNEKDEQRQANLEYQMKLN